MKPIVISALTLTALIATSQSYAPPVAFSFDPNPTTTPPSTAFSTIIVVSDVDTNASNQPVNNSDYIEVAVYQINSSSSSGSIVCIQTGTTYKYSHSKTSKAEAGTYYDLNKFKDTISFGNYNDTGGNWADPVAQEVRVGNGQGGSEGGGDG